MQTTDCHLLCINLHHLVIARVSSQQAMLARCKLIAPDLTPNQAP